MKKTMYAGLFALVAVSILASGAAIAHSEDEHAGPAYGKPGNAMDVTRTVTLIATEMRYSENHLTFRAGDTVKFILINNGTKDHELMIADHAEQVEHRNKMAAVEGFE